MRAFLLALLIPCLATLGACGHTPPKPAQATAAGDYGADGRLPAAELLRRVERGLGPGWRSDTVYAYPGQATPPIRAWHTVQSGPALWLVSGVHGEESAGPNAIARHTDVLRALAASGVPVVLVPLANPNAYRHNWRYPNTAERDWKTGGGYSVGDSEYLLPDLAAGTGPRAAKAPGPETEALTRAALRLAESHPPRLVLDLHEDELSVDGGYIYSQGERADGNPVGAEIIRALQSAGITLRLDGRTRFDEPIVGGVISRDDKGAPIRDGSIDELLSAQRIFVDGAARPGPGAKTVIVVETPADASVSFEKRVSGHAQVLQRLPALWRLNGGSAD